MLLLPRLIPLLLITLTCSFGIVHAADEKSDASDNSSDDTQNLFPVGKPWINVRIPRQNEKDELTNLIHSETLTRKDERSLKLQGVTMVFFDPNKTVTVRIKTAEGFYDMVGEKMSSRTKTFIEHSKFDMTGDSSEFDVKTQKGQLNGNVEMIIYDAGSAMPSTAPPSKPSPATTASTHTLSPSTDLQIESKEKKS